jgi:peptidoglycan/LPS O-acetylase OafA/YrhL
VPGTGGQLRDGRGFLVESPGRSAGLDFLRATAILLVLLRHFTDRNPQYDAVLPDSLIGVGLFGWAGVDLFYVLSGFLIFSMLFDYAKKSRLSVRSFYVNRILRIWPAYFASLLIALLLGEFAGVYHLLPVFGLFLQNYIPETQGVNGNIYWSIAVEEHFYLLAPLLALLVTGMDRRRGLLILLGLIAVPLVARLITYGLFVQGDRNLFYRLIYFPTHTRFDTILFGVLCAYVTTYYPEILRGRWFRRLLPPVWLALLGAAVVATLPLSKYLQQADPVAATLGYSLVAAAAAATVLVVHGFALFDRLGGGPMRVIAHLSYAMYLYHMMCLQLVGRWFEDAAPGAANAWIHLALYAGLTMLAAAVSYAVVERYFLLLKKRIKLRNWAVPERAG